jgi:hypothetical protein
VPATGTRLCGISQFASAFDGYVWLNTYFGFEAATPY